ncbi:VCBS domain-containing protein [Vibrio sp. B1Z05]|uniref:VCBS domain-containing protein n=1 Tax=Vibrio sp. B1Z05 TaxID=2654980 RepID=UPI00128AF06C|nr:VCBS domain-containing protein [Vibrio sp. B1Z05]MPW35916.1 tandem-95 repeat protein [Vibrio sp. B1Z05]
MADLGKNKKATEVSKSDTKIKRVRKTRRLVIPQTYFARNNSMALILPSYHVVDAGHHSEHSVSDRIHHSEYVEHSQPQSYEQTEVKGKQSVNPQPTTQSAMVTDEFLPKHQTENTGGHHYHYIDHYGNSVTPLTGVLSYGQFTTAAVTTTDSHSNTNTSTQPNTSYLTPPVIGVPESGTVKEDTALVTHGTIDAHSAQKGTGLTFTPDNVHGQYGEFALDKDSGEWSYTLDNSHHQNLALGETHTETLHVTITNTAGVSVYQDITVTVQGTNDIPVITSQTQHGATKEDGTLFVQGQVTATDVDHGAVLTYTPDNLQGHYGVFSLNSSTGKWHYTLDNNAHQALAQGESHTETLLVTVTDDKGAMNTQQVIVTVEGTNDKPVLHSDVHTGDVNEDGTLFVRGQVLATDVDHNNKLTYTSGNHHENYGSFTLNPDSGTWTYTLDNAHHQALAQGEVHTESMLVTVTDDKGATVTENIQVTITGTNDKPVITSNAQAATVKEDDVLFVDGQVTATDVDHHAVLTYTPDSLQGTYGTFVLNQSSGKWHYTLDNNAHQALAEGESHVETMLVTVTDDQGATTTQQVSVTVEGTNDKPVLHADTHTGSVNEDGTLFARGQVLATDVDHNSKLTYTAGSEHGTYGDFTLNADSGTWTYTLDNQHHQDLAAGETHTESMLVTVTDDKGATVTETVQITVTGTNDKPVITSNAQAATVKEDDVLFVDGQVTATDADHNAVLTYTPDNLQGTYGTFVLNPSSGIGNRCRS